MARQFIKMSVDKTRAANKLRSLMSDVKSQADKDVNYLGDVGKQHARLEAPYYSGQTLRKIKLLRANNKEEAIIVATNILNDGHVRKIARFDLTRWMHQSRRASSHIKSGNPKFMYETAEYLRRIAPATVRTRYNRLLTKYR